MTVMISMMKSVFVLSGKFYMMKMIMIFGMLQKPIATIL